MSEADTKTEFSRETFSAIQEILHKPEDVQAFLERGDFAGCLVNENRYCELAGLLNEAGKCEFERAETLKILIEAGRREVEKDAALAANFQVHLLHAIHETLNYGYTENLRILLEELGVPAQQDKLSEELIKVCAWGVSEQDKKFDNLAEKAMMVFDVVENEETQREAFLVAAREGNTNVFKAVLKRVEDTKTRHAALIMAANAVSNSWEKREAAPAEGASERSRRHVEILLAAEASYPEDVVFEAIENAIENKRFETLALLADYAKNRYPEMLNRETAQRTTLLVTAAQHPYAEGAARSCAILLRNGAFPCTDDSGQSPVDILRKKGFAETQVVQDMEAVLNTLRKLAAQKVLVQNLKGQFGDAGGMPSEALADIVVGLLPTPENDRI